MKELKNLFDNNRDWASRMHAENPDFFANLTKQQAPPYLWIGCSDSRVPANQIVGLMPGEVFVHRNIANVVSNTDLNCLSVLQYAVEVLKVRHVIVCGHYGCGGVAAALGSEPFGLIDNWLRNIKDVYEQSSLPDEEMSAADKVNRMCEINVAAQVKNVCHTTIVQDAWRRGQQLSIHGWIYGIHDGHLKDLDLCISDPDALSEIYRMRASSKK